MDYELYNADCLDILPELAPQSIDAVICDPPYGTTACTWDSVIPFAPMWDGIRRVLRPRGACVLFGSQPFTSALVMSNVDMFKYTWVWDTVSKTDAMNAPNKPMRRHDDVCVFSLGTTANRSPRKMHYYPQGLTAPTRSKPQDKRSLSYIGNYMGSSRPSHAAHYTYKHANYPSSIIRFSNADRGDVTHPTQKPLALLEYLVKTYTNEGDTVLDFTMGSGTTGHACGNLSRRFIGIEMDKGYYDIASERIATAYAPLRHMQQAAAVE